MQCLFHHYMCSGEICHQRLVIMYSEYTLSAKKAVFLK